MRLNRYTIAAFTGLMAVLAGCSGQSGGHGGFAMPPMPVEVASAQTQTVSDKFESVGTIEALEAITVVSEIDGAVTGLPFVEGGAVRKGDTIARLDDRQLAAEVERAEALHTQSHTTYERTKAVVDQKAGTPQDLDDAAAGLKVADANLALAKARLAKAAILAPFDGIAGSRKVSLGTFLRAGSAITDLANIDEIRVGISVPERFLGQIHPGAEVSVSTTAFPGYAVTGKVIAVEPVLDPVTRSARVIARVPNPGRKFRPGMSANVSAELSRRTDAVTVPNEAVFASGNQSYVFTVKPDSTVTRIPVTLGTHYADVVEITSGLAAGTMVVRAGHQKLFEGAHVFPAPAQAVAGPDNQGAAH